MKGYIASAWCSKQLKLGGNNLAHINFNNIANEIKFIDSLKYYQKSLAELVCTLSDEEKIAIKKLTEQFFNQHHYFSGIWAFLNSGKKKTNFGNCLRRKRYNTLWINYWNGIIFFNS